MPKYTSPDGHIFEGDDWQEVKELVNAVLGSNTPFVHKPTPTNSNQSIPSVSDFQKALQVPDLKQFLDFVKKEGSSGTISDSVFKQQTGGKKSLSGLGQRFKKFTGGASLSQLIKKNSNQNTYDVDKSAYNNLMQA